MTTYDNVPEKGSRTAEYIVDHSVPLSDLTESELDSLVEYRAAIKARDAAYVEQMQALDEAMQSVISIHEKATSSAEEKFAALVAKAGNHEQE